MSAAPAGPSVVARMGEQGWEFWRLRTKGTPTKESEQQALRASHLIVASPTRTFLGVPLWVAPSGDPSELVGLEFAARHLARRGHQVVPIEIERDTDRALVLGVLAADDAATAPFLGRAHRYELPARLLAIGEQELAVWKEEGLVCFGFFRDGKCVFFSATGERTLTTEAAALIARTAQRLHSEEVLKRMPGEALVVGEFAPTELVALEEVVGCGVSPRPESEPPRLPGLPADLAPPSALLRRERKQQIKKVAVIAAAAAAVYIAVAAVTGWFYASAAMRLSKLEAESASLHEPAEAARAMTERWKAIRSAVDPAAFALDVFAAVAREIPADNVRFTQFSFDGGMVVVAGEAADVSQTYELIERLKKSPRLAEFDWTARPPEIAAKSTIRFEIEGRRPDAIAVVE